MELRVLPRGDPLALDAGLDAPDLAGGLLIELVAVHVGLDEGAEPLTELGVTGDGPGARK